MTREKLHLSALLLLLLATTDEPFRRQCDQLSVDTALVVQSESIDDYPLWSPDSRSLGVKLSGKWKAVRLDDLTLVPGRWLGSPIALARNPELARIPEAELEEWRKKSDSHERALKLPTGECVRFNEKELSTSLEITDAKGKSRVLWHTDLQVCYGPSLSPNGRYLAYVCELSGLMVSEIPKLLAKQGEPTEAPANCTEEGNPVYSYQIILPDGFIGWVRVDFGVNSAPPLGDKKAVIRVDDKGRFRTSSVMIVAVPGVVECEFFYQSGHGLRPVPDDLVSHELDAGGFGARADDYQTPVKPSSWYFLLAPRSYRSTHPNSDFIEHRKPLPTPGRLNLP